MNEVEILIISNKYDYATDFICKELQRRARRKYLRLNRDEFSNYKTALHIGNSNLSVEIRGVKYLVNQENLSSIYYRAPTFLRDIYQPYLSPEEQMYRTQWLGFIKNLVIFEDILWINNPVYTYKAENKLLQLRIAQKVGLEIPDTFIMNNSDGVEVKPDKFYMVKTLEPAILRIGDKEAFIYSNIVKGSEILNHGLSLFPFVLQENIFPKIDIRVTVVREKVYAVKILKNGEGIEGDWRREKKEKLKFLPFRLPKETEIKCIELTGKLGLNFGAIDLAFNKGKYFFFEINPTGEWAWLVKEPGFNIHEAICDLLENLR